MIVAWVVDIQAKKMIHYSRIANKEGRMLKGQDIVVLAALMGDGGDGESYLELGRRVCLSDSEKHAAVRRLQTSSLLTSDRPCYDITQKSSSSTGFVMRFRSVRRAASCVDLQRPMPRQSQKTSLRRRDSFRSGTARRARP